MIGHGGKTCIPAEVEPSLESGSCYPLVNFTRPFCQNHGVTLPNYVYTTPHDQHVSNYESNRDFDAMENFGMSRITNVYGTDVATVRKCLRAGILAFCHYSFPGCDRTQSIVAEQTICRESCLESISMCPKKIYDDLYVYAISLDPRDGKKYRCELQPYRNAGDSPECYFYRVRTNFTTGRTAGTYPSFAYDVIICHWAPSWFNNAYYLILLIFRNSSTMD